MRDRTALPDGEAAALYESSGAAGIGLAAADFRRLLDGILAGVGEDRRQAAQILSGLHLTDLVLARACALGLEAAWERFISLYRAKLLRAAIAMTADEIAGRDLADSLYADLFGTRLTAAGERCCKLNFYSGRGSLESWLRALLAQQLVNHSRERRRFVEWDEERAPLASGTSLPSLPPAIRLALEKATDAVLAGLTPEERLLLSAYYLDGRTLAIIGRMLNISESSASRRLKQLTNALRKRIVKALCRQGYSMRAAEEALHSDVGELDVDVQSLFSSTPKSTGGL